MFRAVPVRTILALFLCASTPAWAAEDEENLCLPVLRIWNGTAEDVRSIDTIPVPAAYSEAVQSCGGPLRSLDLMGWHARFGTEDSSWRAFEFITRRDGHFREEARSAAVTINREVRRASSVITRAANRPSRQILMQQASTDLQQKLSWPVSQLGYPLDLALDAITAAETFRSKRFRDAAMEWMTIFEASRMQVGMPSPMPVNVTQTEDSPQAILSKQLLESGIDRRADAIRTRIAILDATERLDQTGLARVDELISKQSTPALQQIQKYAFGAGDDFCDLPEFADATVKAACEDEPNFERSAKQFLYLEAEAELLRGFDFNAERFFRLYDRDIKENGDWDTRWTGIDPRVVTLKEAQAEMLLRKSGAKTDGEITSDADVYKMQWALEKFVNITRMFSPADDVVRFRRIATRALLIDTRIKTYNQKRGTEPFTQFDQAMTYFRILLPQLNPFPAD